MRDISYKVYQTEQVKQKNESKSISGEHQDRMRSGVSGRPVASSGGACVAWWARLLGAGVFGGENARSRSAADAEVWRKLLCRVISLEGLFLIGVTVVEVSDTIPGSENGSRVWYRPPWNITRSSSQTWEQQTRSKSYMTSRGVHLAYWIT